MKALKGALLFTALASTFFIMSCSKDGDDDGDTMYTISGNASGSQEVPAVTTTGTGTLNGTYNASTNKLDYTINWTGLTTAVNVAHFHGPALAGVSAGPMVNITVTNPAITGSAAGSVTVHDSVETHLLNGRVYYNIHTVNHPGGEIRGQVTATPQ